MPRNREKYRTYQREYRENHRDSQKKYRENHPPNKEKRYVEAKKRKLELRAWFKDYKATLKCTRCPESDPVVLDFHHPNADKVVGISRLVSRGGTSKHVLEEIEKCVVLCSNCHRKEHAAKDAA